MEILFMQYNEVIYRLELTMGKCLVQAVINGLRQASIDATHGGSFACPINDNLIGEDNIVEIIVMPAMLESGQLAQVSDILVGGAIKIYETNEDDGSDNAPIVIERFDFANIITKRQREAYLNRTVLEDGELKEVPDISFPVDFGVEFDNKYFSFRNRFLESEIIDDKEMLLDYAEFLRDLIIKHDTSGLYREFKTKFDDYNIAYPKYAEDDEVTFPQFLNSEFFPGGPITDFERDDIGLKSWCEGRVWEIFVKPNQPLFITTGLNKQINEIDIFVGLVEGELKVIR